MIIDKRQIQEHNEQYFDHHAKKLGFLRACSDFGFWATHGKLYFKVR